MGFRFCTALSKYQIFLELWLPLLDALCKSFTLGFTHSHNMLLIAIQDCFGRPISSAPDAWIDVVERVSNDNNKTLKWVLGYLVDFHSFSITFGWTFFICSFSFYYWILSCFHFLCKRLWSSNNKWHHRLHGPLVNVKQGFQTNGWISISFGWINAGEPQR